MSSAGAAQVQRRRSMEAGLPEHRGAPSFKARPTFSRAKNIVKGPSLGPTWDWTRAFVGSGVCVPACRQGHVSPKAYVGTRNVNRQTLGENGSQFANLQRFVNLLKPTNTEHGGSACRVSASSGIYRPPYISSEKTAPLKLVTSSRAVLLGRCCLQRGGSGPKQCAAWTALRCENHSPVSTHDMSHMSLAVELTICNTLGGSVFSCVPLTKIYATHICNATA